MSSSAYVPTADVLLAGAAHWAQEIEHQEVRKKKTGHEQNPTLSTTPDS